MEIVELNRIVLLILMSYCIYTVFMFNKKISVDIEISKTKLENLSLDRKKIETDIEINIKYLKKLSK